MIHKEGCVEDDVTQHIKVRWLKWRKVPRVLCDKKVPLKLKRKLYRSYKANFFVCVQMLSD